MNIKNLVRRGFYADSVALMRIARELQKLGVEASLLIGTPSNKALLRDSGLLTVDGEGARPDDLIIAVRGRKSAEALGLADKLLLFQVKSNESEIPKTLPNANLALISVPGEFAAREARRALERGMHAMVFSDNVPVADEIALKDLAASKGLLLMGPDCGTALIAGVPTGIDVRRVVDTGIQPAINTGIAHRLPGVGQVGAGVARAPLACFDQGLLAFALSLGFKE